MAKKTLYKDGRTTSNYSQAKLQSYLDSGWSLTAPSSSPKVNQPSQVNVVSSPQTPTPTPTLTPSAQGKKFVWSNRGTKKEIPASRYNEYISAGWHASAPGQTPSVPPETPTAPPPTTVATSDQLRAEQAEEALPYVKYADSNDVFDKDGNHITAEQAAEIPDFWNQVQMSGEGKPEGLMTPIESIGAAFGDPNWQPSAAFTPELQAQGIFGAVKIGDKVWTIGPDGEPMSPERYKQLFGQDISDTTGIAGEVDIATAIKLGINVTSDTILDPVKPIDPYEMWTKFKEEGQEDVNKLRDKLFEATNSLIEWMKGFGETKAEAKEEEKERLKMEEKSQAIADAQTAANDLQAAYDKEINNERFRRAKSSSILGRQAKLKSMKAVELAPMLISIQIAQGNWDRAKEMLDDWSDDYNENMNMQMQAAQMNIDMITGELNREQTEQLEDAKVKFSMWQDEENRRLDTQEEVKKMMMMYNGQGAGININDNWETAYQKASTYIESELKFERDMKDLDKKIKEKSLITPTGRGYAPSSHLKLYNELGGEAVTGLTFSEWYKEQQGGDKAYTDIEIQDAIADGITRENILGEDGKMAWEDYVDIMNTWYNTKGSTAGFESRFPKERYLDWNNRQELETYLTQ